jgi:hypothetical protein
MAGSSDTRSGPSRGAFSGCDDVLRKRTHAIPPAATVTSAIAPASISKSINISAIIIIRNAITGLSRTRAQRTDPVANFRMLLIQRPASAPTEDHIASASVNGLLTPAEPFLSLIPA